MDDEAIKEQVDKAVAQLKKNCILMNTLIGLQHQWLNKQNRGILSDYLTPFRQIDIRPFKLLGIFNFGLLIALDDKVALIVKVEAAKMIFKGFVMPKVSLREVVQCMKLHKFVMNEKDA